MFVLSVPGAAGIVGLFKITAAPVVAFQSDCTLETLLFQLVISVEVIPAAALALNTGSVSVVNVPAFFVKPQPLTVDSVTAVGIVTFFLVVLTERSPEVAVVVPETLST